MAFRGASLDADDTAADRLLARGGVCSPHAGASCLRAVFWPTDDRHPLHGDRWNIPGRRDPAASTRDIEVVLIDCADLPRDEMARAGFRPVAGARHAWRYRARGQPDVDLDVAALASSTEAAGPFSIVYQQSRRARIEGVTVRVAFPDAAAHRALSVAQLRARLRDVYRVGG